MEKATWLFIGMMGTIFLIALGISHFTHQDPFEIMNSIVNALASHK